MRECDYGEGSPHSVLSRSQTVCALRVRSSLSLSHPHVSFFVSAFLSLPHPHIQITHAQLHNNSSPHRYRRHPAPPFAPQPRSLPASYQKCQWRAPQRAPYLFFSPSIIPRLGCLCLSPRQKRTRAWARFAATTAAGVEPQSASRTQKGFHPVASFAFLGRLREREIAWNQCACI